MKHIQATGCGFTLNGKPLPIEGSTVPYSYDGVYNCTGIADFNPAFKHTTITGGTDSNYYDNYYNLPQKIKGFIMTLSPVIDMSKNINITEYAPEVNCTKDFDPITADEPEIIDYYTKYGDDRLYVSLVSDDTVTGSTISGSTMWTEPEYTTEDTIYELAPGALEPMIDTMFPPIGVDNITVPDLRMTGGFVIDKLNNSWHTFVESNLSNLYRRINGIHTDTSTADGLFNLENAKNQEGSCENFQIQLISSLPIIGTSVSYPVYAISGGTVRVDNTLLEIEGSTMNGAIFDAYLEVYLDGSTYHGDVFEAVPGVLPDEMSGHPHAGHVAYEYIGNVRRIQAAANSPRETHERFTEYVINQADCIYEIILGGTGGGSTVTEEYEYNGPFKLAFDSGRGFYVTGPDITGNTNMAGQIYRCGEFADEYGPIKGGIGEGFVYAHVKDNDVVYDNAASLTEISGETTTTVDCYTVRLGSGTIVPATTVEIPVIVEGATEYRTTAISGLTAGVNISGTTILEPVEVPGNTATIGSFDVIFGGITVNVPVENTADIEQYHMGDIYVDCPEDIPVPPPEPADYGGPFAINLDGTVTCSVCPSEGTGDDAVEIAGYYSINGTGGAYTGSVPSVVLSLTGGTTNVFLNVTADDASLSTTQNTAANCYSVWIGSIVGATVTGTTTYIDPDTEEEVTKNIYGAATGVRQMHYGNVQVDGRWS